MYKIPLPEIKEKLIQSGKINSKDLELKIKAKINDLSGLISEEGAAHIIANELGVELVSTNQSKLKIKEIYPGMRSVHTVGKVMRIFEMREFSKGDKHGKVASIIIGDDSGTIRVVFWNEQVDLLQKVKEGDILLIKEAYARDNQGNKEIHLGERGELKINPEGEQIAKVRQSSAYERKAIGDLQPGEEGVELMGTVVQVFDPRFFNVCPQCGKKANETEGGFLCAGHGVVVPSLSYVLNLILDDGTGTIRSVFWKNQTNYLLGKTEVEVSAFKEDPATFENVKTDLLGEQFRVMGRVNKNDLFDRLEFNVQLIERAKPEEEVKRLEKA